MDSFKVEKEIRYQNNSGKVIVFPKGSKVTRVDLLNDKQLQGWVVDKSLVKDAREHKEKDPKVEKKKDVKEGGSVE